MLWYKNDVSGGIGRFSNDPGAGWTLMNQSEIDAELLKESKSAKIIELDSDLSVFENAGYTYLTRTFCLSNDSTNNIALKDLAPSGMTDRYKYYDMSNTQRDFTDAAGFIAFKDAMFTEKDRIMCKYNVYKAQINACADVAAVDAITISFAV